MDDFDRDGRQIGNRAKYRLLMETLLQRGPLHSEDEIRVSVPPRDVPAEQARATAATVDIQEMVRSALMDAQILPEARQLLSSRVKAYLEHKNKTLRGNKHLSEIGTKIGLFIQTVGDKAIHSTRQTISVAIVTFWISSRTRRRPGSAPTISRPRSI